LCVCLGEGRRGECDMQNYVGIPVCWLNATSVSRFVIMILQCLCRGRVPKMLVFRNRPRHTAPVQQLSCLQADSSSVITNLYSAGSH